jgi:predicted PurR-regulated permease PerM
MTGRATIYDTLRRLGVITWSLIGAVVFVGLLVWGIIQVKNVIPAVVLATAIIYLLNPVVSILAHRGVPRILGSCISYLVLLAVVSLVVWLAFPSIADQAQQLGDDFPTIYDDLATDAEGWAKDVGVTVEIPRYDDLDSYFASATEDGGLLSLDRVSDFTLSVLEFLLILVLAPVLAFYLLMDLPKLSEKASALVPAEHRDEALHVGHQLSRAVGGFLRGQLVVALIVGMLTSFGFWVIGLDFWLLIGMIAGFLNIIPFVGPWVGGALGVLVALATADPGTAVAAAVVAAAVQQVDNHFISPSVLRVTVRLHPATIILALLVGGTLGGLLGVLLAVPVTAAVKIIIGHFWRTRVLGQSWEEASEALTEDHRTQETVLERLLDDEEDQDTKPAEVQAP